MGGISSIFSGMLSQFLQQILAAQGNNNNDQSDQNQFNDCMQKHRHQKSQQCQQSGG